MKPIVSMRDLSSRLGIPVAEMRTLAASRDSDYRVRKGLDKKGKERTFEVPTSFRMEIQRRFVREILSKVDISPAAHGAVKGRSPRTNAEAHLGQELVVTADVDSCFPSISHREIFKMLRRDLGFGTEVSSVLTSLTTFRGHLPQGAASSPAMVNVLLAESLDRHVDSRAKELGVTYTRYVDDLGFSGAQARELLQVAAGCLAPLGLKLARNKKKPQKVKLKIARRDERQVITGLGVNAKRALSVGRKQADRVRAAIHQFSGVTKTLRPLALQSIKGRIAYVGQFNKGRAKRLQHQFEAALKGLELAEHRAA